VVGSVGVAPDTKTKPLAMIAWEKIPGRGAGAPDASTGVFNAISFVCLERDRKIAVRYRATRLLNGRRDGYAL
jgi:hypothetical protein